MRLIHRRVSPMHLVLARGVAVSTVEDGKTLLDPRGTLLHLNTTAGFMLDTLLANGQDAAAAATCRRFGIAEDTARADVARLLTELLDRKLVRWT